MHRYADFLIMIVYLAIIFVMVRPGSQGPKLVQSFGDSTSGLIKAATGGGSWSG